MSEKSKGNFVIFGGELSVHGVGLRKNQRFLPVTRHISETVGIYLVTTDDLYETSPMVTYFTWPKVPNGQDRG